MRIKNWVLLLILITGTNAFADSSIVNRNYLQKSAIQYSNYRQKPTAQYYAELMAPAVKEIKSKIIKDPYNYSLHVNLVEIYLKARQYDQALDELALIYKAKKANNLNSETISILSKMYSTQKRFGKKDPILSFDIAIIALILDDENAVDYAIAGASRSNNMNLTKKTLDLLFDSEKNPEKAIEICNTILDKNPNDIEVRKIKAAYHTQLNQPRDAIGEYIRIVETDTSDDEARYNLYKLLRQHGRVNDNEMINRLYGMKPDFDFEKSYIALAELLLEHSDFADAKYYAETAIKKYNQNPNTYILMADIYKREGRIADAYDVLTVAREKADDNETIAKYNVMLAKMSDEPVKEANQLIANTLYSQALEVLKSANPDSLYVILTQARANYLLGKKTTTFELLNKAMSLYPNNSDVYCAFGYIYLQEKDIETARNYVNQSLSIDKNNKTAMDLLNLVNKADSSQYTSKILDAMETQNYDEAMRLVDEAISIDKKSADLYYYKSLILIAQNNYRAAAVSLHNCIDQKRDYTDAYFYLGVSYENINDKQSAVGYYKKFLELSQNGAIGSSEKTDYARNRLNKLQQN